MIAAHAAPGIAENPAVVAALAIATLSALIALSFLLYRKPRSPAPPPVPSQSPTAGDRASRQPATDATPYAGGAYTVSGGHGSVRAEPPPGPQSRGRTP